MRSCLWAAGVYVSEEVAKASLILSSEQNHLVDGQFDIDLMIHMLQDQVEQALKDGYRGLWAVGDMTWELGSEKNFEKLIEYEWRLEEYFRKQPALSGVCQYHVDTMPAEAAKQGLLTHPALFFNETLSRMNPCFVEPRSNTENAASDFTVDEVMSYLCELQNIAEPA